MGGPAGVDGSAFGENGIVGHRGAVLSIPAEELIILPVRGGDTVQTAAGIQFAAGSAAAAAVGIIGDRDTNQLVTFGRSRSCASP